jgi:hypothetical protein
VTDLNRDDCSEPEMGEEHGAFVMKDFGRAPGMFLLCPLVIRIGFG